MKVEVKDYSETYIASWAKKHNRRFIGGWLAVEMLDFYNDILGRGKGDPDAFGYPGEAA